MKRIAKAFFLLSVFIATVIFSLANYSSVSVNYFFGEFDLPLSALIIATLTIGIIIGLLTGLLLILKYRRQIKTLKKQVESSSTELNILRNFPIKDHLS